MYGSSSSPWCQNLSAIKACALGLGENDSRVSVDIVVSFKLYLLCRCLWLYLLAINFYMTDWWEYRNKEVQTPQCDWCRGFKLLFIHYPDRGEPPNYSSGGSPWRSLGVLHSRPPRARECQSSLASTDVTSSSGRQPEVWPASLPSAGRGGRWD